MTPTWRETVYGVVRDAYLETALWSSNDWDDMDESDNPNPFDDNFSIEDFAGSAKDRAYADCAEFMEALNSAEVDDESEYEDLWDAAEDMQSLESIGHDLWLTRNGHGAGFWDGDYGDYGDRITELVYAVFGRYSEINLYVNRNGEVDY